MPHNTPTEQVAAITRMRRDIEKYFPGYDFYYIELDLISRVELKDNEEISYDEKRQWYIIEVLPECKVCRNQGTLTEIPIMAGKFYLCRDCLSTIAKAKTLNEVMK